MLLLGGGDGRVGGGGVGRESLGECGRGGGGGGGDVAEGHSQQPCYRLLIYIYKQSSWSLVGIKAAATLEEEEEEEEN